MNSGPVYLLTKGKHVKVRKIVKKTKVTYCGVTHGVLRGGCYCTSQASRCLGGFLSVGSPARARALRRSLFGHTLSERRGARPRPTGSLTARLLGNGGSALPRVSTCLLLFTRPPSVVTWDCASSFAPARLRQSPALWLKLAPSATPQCFCNEIIYSEPQVSSM